MHLIFFLIFLSLKISDCVRLRHDFAPTHIYHTPTEMHESPCSIQEQFRTCSLKTFKKDAAWTGFKVKPQNNEKFVALQPTPKGNFDHARRVCETCDLEVAEIWDEDDLGQVLEAVGGVNGNGSYWIGAFLNKKQPKKLRWTYQDGKTFVGFKESLGEGVEDKEDKNNSTFTRSCLVLKKKGEFSEWGVVPCETKNKVLCQYKKKYDCYDGTARGTIYPIKDGYYFSTKGQRWSLASHSCQANPQVPLSLLFFQLQSHTPLTALLTKHLTAHHHNPSETEIWTAAKIEAGTFYWMVNDQRVEIKEWKSLPWGTLPDAEGSNKDLCVYAKVEKEGLKLYGGDCDKERFFVCKTLELDGPQISYCEKDSLIERKSSDCKWNWIFNKKPSCLCFKGVHGVTSHTTCNTRLLIGPRCIKLASDKKSILHWKPIPNVDPEGPFLLIQNRNRRGNKFIQWSNLKPGSKRQIFGDANIYFSKGINVTTSNGKYCFSLGKWEEGKGKGDGDGKKKTQEFQEIRIRNESSWISFDDKANEKMRCRGTTKPKIKIHGKNSKDECQLKCTKKKSEPKEPIEGKKRPKKTQEVANLNTEMLKHTMDSMFPTNKTEKVVHDKRFQLLEKLFEIAKNICACMVPAGFFNNALELFKIAYTIESYEYVEDFRKVEVDKIAEMLANCQDFSGEKAVVCERNECNGRAVKTTELTTDTSFKTTPVDDTGYANAQHHHLMEVVWHAIEIWNVGCIREFKESYLLYHALEQSLEKLFAGEIRKLWHAPSVPQNYYKHLLGANEATHVSNLQNCVHAVYEGNPKVLRLTRPKSSPLELLGKQIRNRKRNEDFLHDKLSKTIFCSKDQFCMD